MPVGLLVIVPAPLPLGLTLNSKAPGDEVAGILLNPRQLPRTTIATKQAAILRYLRDDMVLIYKTCVRWGRRAMGCTTVSLVVYRRAGLLR